MYWTHLIFALVLGLVHLSTWTFGTKPGYLDFDNLPETNFSCEGKVIGGYYADVETGCQMFHVCTIGQKGNKIKTEVTDIKFLCLNGTVFDQETRVCERIDEVDCSKSEDFFGLNLELYGNNGNFGIQPENEFECEDCGTEDYDLETTTTTTTTTPKPTTTTTTTTTTTQPPKAYPASSPETFAALLALHNAFQESFNAKVKPPPPRVINNAFQTTKPPYRIEYLNQPPRQKPIYQPTTPLPKANYHHFSSSDASFGHSFDQDKPYNFQFFHSRKLEEPQKEVSVVTSTSTSTSVRTSKNLTEYDYDDLDFYDVPKLRQKREEHHPNHRYPEEHHKKNDTRENFLKNLLNSIDMEDTERDKMVKFFIKEEQQMEGGMLNKLGHKLGEIIMEDVNKTIQKQNDSLDLDELSRLWRLHYEEMSQEVNLDFAVDNKLRTKRDLKERPVFEEVDEGDFTTAPYRRVAQKQRTTSRPVKSIRFNYETSKNPPEPPENEETKLTTSAYRRTTSRPRRLKTRIHSTTSQTPKSDGHFKIETSESLRQRVRTTAPSEAILSDDLPREVTRPRQRPADDDSLSTVERRPNIDASGESLRQRVRTMTPSEATRGDDLPREFTRPRQRPADDDSLSTVERRPNIDASGESLRQRARTTDPSEATRDDDLPREVTRPRQRPADDDSLSSVERRPNIDASGESLRHRARTTGTLRGDDPPRESVTRHRPSDTLSIQRRPNSNVSGESLRQRVRTTVPAEDTLRGDDDDDDDIPRVSVTRPRQRPDDSSSMVQRRPNSDVSGDSFRQRVRTFPAEDTLRGDDLPKERPDDSSRKVKRPPSDEQSPPQRTSSSPAQSEVPKKTRSRGHVRGGRITEEVTSTTTIRTSILPDQKPDPDFNCEDKVKGGFYADILNDCRGFFICSQGQINGPLLKSHFWCGATTKFNQRSRTCQAENLVECSISARYFHLNDDFRVPESESDLRGTFEPSKVKN